jgi:hypothetical protein
MIKISKYDSDKRYNELIKAFKMQTDKKLFTEALETLDSMLSMQEVLYHGGCLDKTGYDTFLESYKFNKEMLETQCQM